MRINHIYLRDIVAIMDALEQIDSASEFLYTKGPVIVTDDDSQKFHLEFDAESGSWYLDTDKSKDIK